MRHFLSNQLPGEGKREKKIIKKKNKIEKQKGKELSREYYYHIFKVEIISLR
jgi:hypothetical protein